jgi:hypothetical protein
MEKIKPTQEDKITVYCCPTYDDLFGGNNLIYMMDFGVKFVLCPVCKKYHAVDNNNQIIEGCDYGIER